MKKLFPIVAAAFALLAGTGPIQAENPPGKERSARLSYGLEWGYDATVLELHHYNYMDATDGFRIDEKATTPMFYSNGHAIAHITLEFARRYALGLRAGYTGVFQRTRIFPLALRGTFFFNSFRTDGQFIYIEGGAGLHEMRKSVSPFGRLGYGYRFVLSRKCSMDFEASLRTVADHPPIYDSTISEYVAEDNVRRSDALYNAFILSVALNF